VEVPETRGLQLFNNANEVGVQEPIVSWSVYRLILDYEFADSVTNDMIGVNLYRDRECSRDITDTQEYLKMDVVPDGTPIGDGSGTRNVRISLTIDPINIQDSRVIAFSDQQAFVTFCIGVSLNNPEFSQEPIFILDSVLSIGVVFTGNVGIVGVIEDDTKLWGIDVFQCNKTNYEIESPQPISQGQTIRLCLVRNNETAKDGIFFRAIDSFFYRRGDIQQEAIMPGQRIGDGDLTKVSCTKGSYACVIESTLLNAFFDSPGTVEGFGSMWLEFGSRQGRYLRRVPFHTRHLYAQGEFVGEKPLDVSFGIQPSNETFAAEVYRCNFLNEEIDLDEKIYSDTGARICFRPDERAREAGVFMRQIETFTFKKDKSIQTAVEAGGISASDGSTLLLCSAGSAICSLKTELDPGFYFGDGYVEGFGEIILQFGPENGGRRAQIVPRRNLQEEDEDGGENSPVQTYSDPGIAGKTSIEVVFGGTSAPVSGLKIVYIAAFVFALLVLCCCCCLGGLYFFCEKHRKEVLLGDMGMSAQEQEESIDAFMDSKASFYTDLDFATDGSDDSSDEETLSEHFEDDLESKVSIFLFPSNADPEDLSQPLGLDPGAGRVMRSQSMHDARGRSPDRTAASDQGPPRRLSGGPGPRRGQRQRMSVSEHGPPMGAGPDRGQRPSMPPRSLSVSDHESQYGAQSVQSHTMSAPNHGLPARFAGRGPGPGRGRRRQSLPGPRGGDTDQASVSDHGSQHGAQSVQSRGRDTESMSVSAHGPPPARSAGRGTGPGRGHRQSNGRGPVPDRGVTRGNSEPAMGSGRGGARRALRGRGRGTPGAGRALGRGRGGAGRHPGGITQVPRPASLRGSLISTSEQGSTGPGRSSRATSLDESPIVLKKIPSAVNVNEVQDKKIEAKGKKGKKKNSPQGADSEEAAPAEIVTPKKPATKKKPATNKQATKKPAAKQASPKQTTTKKANTNKQGVTKHLPGTKETPAKHPSGTKQTTTPKKHPAGAKDTTPKYPLRTNDTPQNHPSITKHTLTKHSPTTTTTKKTATKNADPPSSVTTGTSRTKSIIPKKKKPEQPVSVSESSSSDDDDMIPDEEDVCFEAEGHPGTEAFDEAIQNSLENFGPVAYSPKVYRRIKKQLPGRRFFICDDENNPSTWREVDKSELIDLVWTYYEEEKEKL
jgi:hypothetical protein